MDLALRPSTASPDPPLGPDLALAFVHMSAIVVDTPIRMHTSFKLLTLAFLVDLGLIILSTAEFRGPGVHHRFDDSPDDYDMDIDQRTRMLDGGRSGRIILLGDGTEVLTDGGDNDAEMFDQSDEDEEKDLESQVKKGQASAEDGRNQREETPGPSGDHSTQISKEEGMKQGTGPGATPEEPKMMASTDSIPKAELKERVEGMSK